MEKPSIVSGSLHVLQPFAETRIHQLQFLRRLSLARARALEPFSRVSRESHGEGQISWKQETPSRGTVHGQ